MSQSPEIKPSSDFTFGEVRGVEESRAPRAPVMPPTSPLGPLAPMAGSWVGNGFNTIFRPQSTQTPTPLPVPAVGPNDNVLELNLTSEQTTFTPIPGTIPNRGEGAPQGDISLTGMIYLQNIQDVTFAPATGIHIEPGIWIVIPPTTAPAQPVTVTRMASIPHGTTVNAQGTTSSANGPPTIPSVNITPTSLATGQLENGVFPSQTAVTNNSFRIPQDLTAFIAAGTITQAILDDPNVVLRNISSKQTITKHTQVSISTDDVPPVVAGGGPANIAFLKNTGAPAAPPPTGPNALAAKMTATFWIETVTKEVTLPSWKVGSPSIQIPLVDGLPAVVTPKLNVVPEREVKSPIKVTLTFTQIQYSQTVFLDFNTLSWPHVSVATLIPKVVSVPAASLL
jgi:hypothetical protein